MVGLDEELLSSKVPRESIDPVEDGIGLALVGVPLGGGLREALGRKGDWLVDYLAINGGILEEHRAYCKFRSVRAQGPGQRVVREVEG